jgi:alpha-aminoadipic semialdehyde synthase
VENRWSPRGVLAAATNSASFRLDSTDHSIPGSLLLSSAFNSVPLGIEGFEFEGIANRNSLDYLKEYGLNNDLPTILRGTLRYPGFTKVVDVWSSMGLLDIEIMETTLESWDQLVEKVLEKRSIQELSLSNGYDFALTTFKQ